MSTSIVNISAGAHDAAGIPDFDPTLVAHSAVDRSIRVGDSQAAVEGILVVVEDNNRAVGVDSSQAAIAGLDRTLGTAVAIGRCWDLLQAAG